jgi:hypothetical protein
MRLHAKAAPLCRHPERSEGPAFFQQTLMTLQKADSSSPEALLRMTDNRRTGSVFWIDRPTLENPEQLPGNYGYLDRHSRRA